MKASEEIRSILDRCKSGELNHDQGDYFCGTARCLAGWKVHLDYAEKVAAYRHFREKTLGRFLDNSFEIVSRGSWDFARPGRYAQAQWGLTYGQALSLFSAAATYEEQYAVVEELEAQGR